MCSISGLPSGMQQVRYEGQGLTSVQRGQFQCRRAGIEEENNKGRVRG